MIIAIFIIGAFSPVICSEFLKNYKLKTNNDSLETLPLTLYTFDKTGSKECKVNLSNDIIEDIIGKLEKLKNQTINNPLSEETKDLKIEFVDTLDTFCLIPKGMTKGDVLSLLNPKWQSMFDKKLNSKFKMSFLNIFKSITPNITQALSLKRYSRIFAISWL